MSKWEKYTKDEIAQFVAESFSERALVMKMGYAGAGGNTQKVVEAIKAAYPDLDFSHFTGKIWNKGKTKADDPRIVGNTEKYTLEQVFCNPSPVTHRVMRGYVQRHQLIPYVCSSCGCDGHWQDGEISLELHHIDGNNQNNELSNLTYLCPNCHAMTENYRGLNKKRK